MSWKMFTTNVYGTSLLLLIIFLFWYKLHEQNCQLHGFFKQLDGKRLVIDYSKNFCWDSLFDFCLIFSFDLVCRLLQNSYHDVSELFLRLFSEKFARVFFSGFLQDFILKLYPEVFQKLVIEFVPRFFRRSSKYCCKSFYKVSEEVSPGFFF